MNTTDEAPHQQVLTFYWAWSQHSWLWLSTHSWKIISVKPHLLPSLSSPIIIHGREPNGKRTVHNLSMMHDICVIQNFSTLLKCSFAQHCWSGIFIYKTHSFSAHQIWFHVTLLFTELKIFVGKKFHVKMIISGKMIQFLPIPKTEFTMCFQHWKECWNKCICDRGECRRDFKDHPCKHSFIPNTSWLITICYEFLPVRHLMLCTTLYYTQWIRLDGEGVLICTPTSELTYQIFKTLHKVSCYHDCRAFHM